MHVSLNHGEEFSRVHSPAALWIQSVSSSGFEVCAREAGIGSNGTGILNWLAFQDQPQMTLGSVTFSGMWTTETKCDKVAFSQVRHYHCNRKWGISEKLLDKLNNLSKNL